MRRDKEESRSMRKWNTEDERGEIGGGSGGKQ